ncbi:MAG TPA: GAF domain-containing sensor histidine kinase [Chloroflexi bacterium]|nr:GAF domain-containing sensor histidine kinase [Chloroflexota bacterium]
MVSSRVTLWRLFILGRSVVTGAFLGLLILMNGVVPPAPLTALYLLALVQFATNGFYLYLWRRREIRSLGFLSFSLEILLISLLIWLLGTDGYVFVLAYLWPIIMGGWLIGRHAIPPLTLLGVSSYAGLVLIAQREWLPPQRLVLPTGIPQPLILCLPYLAFISLLVWLLTREMERGERHLQQRNSDLHRVNFGLRYLVAASEELLGCRTPTDLAALALHKVSKLTGHARGAVYLRDGQGFVLRAQNGLAAGACSAPPPTAIPHSWAESAGDPGAETLRTAPLPADEAARLLPTNHATPMALTTVALRSGDGLEGVLAIVAPEAEAFDSGEVQILQVFGHQVGVALENARLLADLQRERNLLSGILAHMADGVLVIDACGRILLANAAAHALLGVQAGETSPDWLAQQMAKEPQGDGAGRHVVAVGDRLLGLSVAELTAGSGVPHATIYVARDVTQEARLEQAKSDFVAYVSHELRTPLTTIKMLVRLLLMDAPEGSKPREYLSVIDTQVTRQTRLVSNLLDLTRLEAGRYDLPIEEVDPGAVLQTAVNVCRPLAEEKGLHLTIACPPQPPMIAANAHGLEQVLVNLLSNAIKWTDRGGSISVSCDAQPDALCLAVEDTGIGMSAHEVERLFEKYATVRRRRQRGEEGTGLGLAISKMIVEELGGTNEVTSQPGVGSRFTVRLPRDEGVAAGIPDQPADASAGAP